MKTARATKTSLQKRNLRHFKYFAIIQSRSRHTTEMEVEFITELTPTVLKQR